MAANLQQRIARLAVPKITVTLDTATPPADATPIDFRNFAGGGIKVASTIASTTFTWYGCDEIDGTYVPLYDSAGVALTTTLPGGAAAGGEIPPGCFGWSYLKISSNADDGESITVSLKG